jgi:Zn-dependent peptidase ImmA (M78 family)/transcriptional regulator with XRE-family HTH domain
MRNGSPGFRPERLKSAREARCLSGQTLADLVGVTRSAISQYERGEQTPSPMVLGRIAEVLNLSVSYFMTEMPSVNATVFYRSFASALAKYRLRAERRLEWLMAITEALQNFIDFPDVTIPHFELNNTVINLKDEEIDEIAGKTRMHWGLSDGPISDLTRLAENQGVVVARHFFDTDRLDAFSYWSNKFSNPFVVLSSDKNCSARSRFDLAHELGHLILHRDIKGYTLSRNADFKHIERQANRFAGALLLPADSFLREVHSLTLDGFVSLKRRWKVSVALMIKRCEDLGVLDDERGQRLWINLGRRGWRKSEPLDDEIVVEQPNYISRCFEVLRDNDATGFKTFIETLPWSASEIEAIAGLPEGMLTPTTEHDESPEPRIIRFPSAVY